MISAVLPVNEAMAVGVAATRLLCDADVRLADTRPAYDQAAHTWLATHYPDHSDRFRRHVADRAWADHSPTTARIDFAASELRVIADLLPEDGTPAARSAAAKVRAAIGRLTPAPPEIPSDRFTEITDGPVDAAGFRDPQASTTVTGTAWGRRFARRRTDGRLAVVDIVFRADPSATGSAARLARHAVFLVADDAHRPHETARRALRRVDPVPLTATWPERAARPLCAAVTATSITWDGESDDIHREGTLPAVDAPAATS